MFKIALIVFTSIVLACLQFSSSYAMSSSLSVDVSISSPMVRRGEAINITVGLTFDSKPAAGCLVTVEVEDPTSNKIYLWTATSNETGQASFSFKIPRDSLLGNYTVFVSAVKKNGGLVRAVAQPLTFMVINNPPAIRSVRISHYEIGFGMILEVNVSAYDVEGDCNVTLRLIGPEDLERDYELLKVNGGFKSSIRTEDLKIGIWKLYFYAVDADGDTSSYGPLEVKILPKGLYEASALIDTYKAEGFNMSLAESILTEALDAYNKGRFEDSKNLSLRALKLAKLIKDSYMKIEEALNSLKRARAEGKMVFLTRAEELLKMAQQALEESRYEDALKLAEQSISESERAINWMIPAAICIIAILLLFLLLRIRAKPRKHN